MKSNFIPVCLNDKYVGGLGIVYKIDTPTMSHCTRFSKQPISVFVLEFVNINDNRILCHIAAFLESNLSHYSAKLDMCMSTTNS